MTTALPTPQDQAPATAVLRALNTHGTLSPASLVKATGLSRATVHRRLLELQDQGFVQSQGGVPRSTYRLLTVQDLLLKQAQGMANLRLVTLTRKQAQSLMSALELFSRLSIGQWGEFAAEWRFRVPMDQLTLVEQAEALLAKAKYLAWKLPSNASLGIYHNRVPAEGARAWEAYQAIRHRLAWDRNPEGSLGTHHDEPLPSTAENASVACWSWGDHVVVLFSPQIAPVFLKAMDVYEEVARGNTSALMLFLSPERTLSDAEKTQCEALLAEAQKNLEAIDVKPPSNAAAWGEARMSLCTGADTSDAGVKEVLAAAIQRCAQAVASSPENTLPEGFLVGFHRHQVQVLQLGENGGGSTIRDSSFSPQTAVRKAQNLAKPSAPKTPSW